MLRCAESSSTIPVTQRERNSRSWLTTTIGRPAVRTNRSSTSRPARSRSLVGSSRSSTSYSESTIAASEIRAACPPESATVSRPAIPGSRPNRARAPGIRSARSPPPSESQRSSATAYRSSAASEVPSSKAARSISSRAASTPVMRPRRAATVSPGRRSGSCRSNPTVASGGLTAISPSTSALERPASASRSVDLPAPLGPVSPQTSPSATTRSRSENRVRAPRVAPTPRSVRVAVMPRGSPARRRRFRSRREGASWYAGRSTRR